MAKSKKKPTPWTDSAEAVYDTDKSGLQTIWDNINKGQKKQIAKIPECKAILDKFGIEYEE